MTTVQLTSSFLSHFDFDETTRVLTVHFKNGKSYPYANVDDETIRNFAAAPSHGAHFSAHIKGKFEAPKEGA